MSDTSGSGAPAAPRRSSLPVLVLGLLLVAICACAASPVLAAQGGPLGTIFGPINQFVGPYIGPWIDDFIPLPGGEGKTCECGGGDLFCEDGFTAVGFPGCANWPEEDCACQGTDLVCDNGTTYADYIGCGGSTDITCECDEGILYCDDGEQYGTEEEPFPGCQGGTTQSCECDEGILYCDDGTEYADVATCGGPTGGACGTPCDPANAACDPGLSCVQWGSGTSNLFVCWAESCQPAQEPACSCDGDTLYCDDGTSYPGHTACAGQPQEPACSCDGDTLYCDDGTSYPGHTACAGQPEQPECVCEGTTYTCSDGTKIENSTACPPDADLGVCGSPCSDSSQCSAGLACFNAVCWNAQTCDPNYQPPSDDGGDDGGGDRCQLDERTCIGQGFSGFDREKCACTGKP